MRIILSCILALASDLSLAADVGPETYFKTFCAAMPRKLAVRLDCYIDNGSSRTAAPNASIGFFVPRTNLTHEALVLDGQRFAAVQSQMPLESGFQRGAFFQAYGNSTDGTWELNNEGQVVLDQKPASKPDLSETLSAYGGLRRLLGLGIKARPGSLTWNGNRFRGIEDVYGSTRLTPRDIVGEMEVSNGVPATATYALGTNNWVTVYYQYARALEVPLPSQMRIETFRMGQDGQKRVSTAVVVNITRATATLAKDDTEQLDPYYFLRSNTVDLASFSSDDFVSVLHLASLLKQPPPGDEVSRFVRDHLSGDTLQLLSSHHGDAESTVALRKSLLSDFNRIVTNENIYQAERFAKVQLSAQTADLVRQRPVGSDLVRLNVMLLLDAYRKDLSKTIRPPSEFIDVAGKSVAMRAPGGPWRYSREGGAARSGPVKLLLRLALVGLVAAPLAAWLWRRRRRRSGRGQGQ
jgi:hypothetical protein